MTTTKSCLPSAALPGILWSLVAGAPAIGLAASVEDLPMTVEPGGYIQIDARAFDEPPPDRLDSFAVRRARLDLDGAWDDVLTFRLGAEFGDEADGEIYDAYIDWRAVPLGSIRVGKFKPPLGLERLQRNPRLLLLERSLVDNLIPNRDIGVAWQTTGRVEAAIGVFNQATDRRRENEDVDDKKVLVARLFGQPFSSGALDGLFLGVAGSYGEAADAPIVSTGQTSGRSTVFRYADGTLRDGTESRLSPQFYWFDGPFGLFGEYVVSQLDLNNAGVREKIANDAWQLTGSWVLSGEDNGWRGVTPARPYQLGGSGWGAWELVARVAQLDYDDDLFPAFADPDASISRARAYEAGLNWYPNAVLKVMFNLAHTRFDGGADSGDDRVDEDVVMARFQVFF